MSFQAYLAYVEEDDQLRGKLSERFTTLVEEGLLSKYQEVSVTSQEVDYLNLRALSEARSLLYLLVTDSFIRSPFAQSSILDELCKANDERVRVVPIIFSKTKLRSTPIEQLSSLPDDGRPVDDWESVSIALTHIEGCIRKDIRHLAEFASGDDTSDVDRAMSTSHSGVAVETSADTIGLEITIDTDFDGFSSADQERILGAIKALLETDDVRVNAIRRGSVKIELELPPHLAERLFFAVEGGELEAHGVYKARRLSQKASMRWSTAEPSNRPRDHSYTSGASPLAGYSIKRCIGRGSFGEVYCALSDAGNEVALKLIRDDFDCEHRGVAQYLNLKHPNLVALHDIRTDENDDCWVVMEYVSGQTLEDVIAQHPNGMPSELVLKWFEGIALGVSFLHDHGIVHRDLKPANIFLDEGTVKIGDYGLSKFVSVSRSRSTTESVSSVHYVAPEIANGRYGREIDTYALGVILYEMLAGHVPFQGKSVGEILMKHLVAEPELDEVPKPFREALRRALAKDPDSRPRGAVDLVRMLRIAQESGDIQIQDATTQLSSITFVCNGETSSFASSEFLQALKHFTSVDLAKVYVAAVMPGSVRVTIAGDVNEIERVASSLKSSERLLNQFAEATGLVRLEWEDGGRKYSLTVSPKTDSSLALATTVANTHRNASRNSEVVSDCLADQVVTQVVLLVHGIRDYAAWQDMVIRQLTNRNTVVRGIKYGYYDVLRFLSPFDHSRESLERLRREFHAIRRIYPSARISVIAHSFGTHLLTKLLEDESDARIWRMVLCGSVVRQSFRWDRIKAQLGNSPDCDTTEYVVNECGSRDIWPVLAKAAGWGYGAAGSNGFGSVLVTDRYHVGGHSLYFLEEFVRKYWRPFIHDGRLVPGKGELGKDIPWWIRLASFLPLKLLPIALTGLLLYRISTR